VSNMKLKRFSCPWIVVIYRLVLLKVSFIYCLFLFDCCIFYSQHSRIFDWCMCIQWVGEILCSIFVLIFFLLFDSAEKSSDSAVERVIRENHKDLFDLFMEEFIAYEAQCKKGLLFSLEFECFCAVLLRGQTRKKQKNNNTTNKINTQTHQHTNKPKQQHTKPNYSK